MVLRTDTLFLPQIPPGSTPDHPPVAWQRWGEGGGMTFDRRTLLALDHLVLADNLDLLKVMHDRSIDLVYIDPPFGTGKRRLGPDTKDAPACYDDSVDDPAEFVRTLEPRLLHLWRILSDNGNLVIHLDPRTIHHVRLWCDSNFGRQHLENEIIWHYTGGGRSKKRFSRKHDVLLWYSKSPDRVFNIDAVREPYARTSGYFKSGIVSRKGKKYGPHPDGTPVDDVWDIPIVNPLSRERAAYPTQKPLKLIERVVSALSSPGDLVCDIYGGSGTTAIASRILGRRFICCDKNPDAIGVTLERMTSLELILENVAILSSGFYLLPFTSLENAQSVSERFLKQALGLENQKPEIIMPSWRKSAAPPVSLRRWDIIARLSPHPGAPSQGVTIDQLSCRHKNPG
jgi:DNA modification methylase